MRDRTVALPPIVRPLLAFFRRIVRGYFRRQFHGVRVSRAERFQGSSGPLIIYANHSSWWDPMVAFLLAAELMPQRKHYAPMDAASLARYPILSRFGVLAVEMKTPRGGVQFLRTGEVVLRAGGVMWVTPQGRFVDARQRPLEFRPGLAALAARVGSCTVLPLAIEYTFWDERLPETLLHFGQAVRVEGERAEEIEERLKTALQEAMEELEGMALRRDPAVFGVTLARGRVGTGGFYAVGQRLVAVMTGRVYHPEHTPSQDPKDGPAVHEEKGRC
jgi:1-acyl-sn-glycerol-3-phosphate acyltransferase